MRGGLIVVSAVAALCAACGGSTAPTFTADPRQYLITLDQMESPGFTVSAGPALLPVSDLAHGDATVAQGLRADGLGGAAMIAFSRTVDFGTANGPLDVLDTVERFNSNDGAHAAFTVDIARRDSQHDEVAMSAGALGDEAHADSLIMTAPDGLKAVQVTLEWRVANAVVVLIARGRYGGTRLDDALLLAHSQTSKQLS